MLKKYGNKSYFSGGNKMIFKDNYDYLLFRQDFNGSESVYFNKNEIEKVNEQINSGMIPIHINYSILYCKNKTALKIAPDWCYSLIWKKDKDE